MGGTLELGMEALEPERGKSSLRFMRASLERLLGRPVDFPAEITLSSGEKYVLPHPDHAHLHPNTRDLVIYPDEGPFSIVVNPDQIVSYRSLRQAS